jgi:hypothetical protein
MGKVRGTFVELQVARDAVIGEIFCDAGFGNAEVIREAGFDGLGAAATGGTAQKAANGDAQRLAWLDKIVRGKIGIAEKEHARTDWSVIGFAKLQWRASEQASELHLEQGKPRREAGIAVAAAHGGRGVRERLRRKGWQGHGFGDSAKARLGSVA